MSYEAGTAWMQVIPSFKGVEGNLRDLAKQLGEQVEGAVEKALPEAMRASTRASRGQGQQAGEQFTSEFNHTIRKRLRTAAKAIPAIQLKADASDLDDTVQTLRKDLDYLSKQRIGFDTDEGTLLGFIDNVRDRLVAAREQARAVGKDFGLGFASDEVASIDFSRVFKERVDAALKSLPDLTIGVARNEVEQEIRDIVAQLRTLSDSEINVDIDANTASATLARLAGELRELDRERVDIHVRTNAASAALQLEGAEQAAQGVSGSVDDMGVRAGVTLGRLGALIAVSAALGTVTVPAAAAAAVAIGAIGTAAAAAAVGVGVFALGMSGISDAVKAMDAAQQDAGKSANTLYQSQARVTDAARSVEDAEDSLANARASAADAAVAAAQRIQDAEQALVDARREAVQANQRAVEQLREAEVDLSSAQSDARTEREALTEAYRDAARALQELDSAVKSNALDQRQATLDIKEAREELEKLLLNPRATEEEREQARITYEQRVLQLEDLKRRSRELGEEQAEATRKGIEGSDEVVQARERIADADERVRKAQQQVQRTQQNVIDTQLQGDRRIQDAEQQLADARRQAAAQARQSAQQIEQAQQAVTQAQRDLRDATVEAGLAGSESMGNLEEAMSKLGPAGQQFARFIYSLREEMFQLRDAAQSGLLPGVEQGIRELLPYFPRLIEFVNAVGTQLGSMFLQGVRAMHDPTWIRFFDFIGDTALPQLQMMFEVTGNLSRGLAEVLLALSPFNEDIGSGLVDLTKRFSDWAYALETTDGYKGFLDYVSANGPRVLRLLGETGELLFDIVEASASIGSVTMRIITALFDGLNSLPTWVLTILATGIAAVSTAMLIAAGVQLAYNRGTQLVNTYQLLAARAADWYSAALLRLQATTATATVHTGRFAVALNTVSRAGAVAAAGIGTAASAINPWTVAITAAVIAAGVLYDAHVKNEQEQEQLALSLKQLGDAYRETHDLTTQAARDAILQSDMLRDLILNAKEYNTTSASVARAAAGERDAQREVIAALEARLEAGKRIAAEAFGEDDDLWLKTARENLALIDQIKILKEHYGEVNRDKIAQEALAAAQREVEGSTRFLSAGTQEYSNLLDLMASKTATAEQKADAFRRTTDALYGSLRTQLDVEEQLASATDTMSETIDRNRGSFKSNEDQLKANTAAGRENRDAIQARLVAVNEQFFADLESGKSLAKATRRHQDNIAKVRQEAKDSKLLTSDVNTLIDAYGQIPPARTTKVAMDGAGKVAQELQDLALIQAALKSGKSIEEAQRELEQTKAWTRLRKLYEGARGAATGGLMEGPGTKTSDSIVIRASRGEFMQQAAAVDHYGVDFMTALNQRRIPKEWLPGFATGGQILPFPVNVRQTWIPSMDEVRAAIAPRILAGGIGSADMMKILRAVFPGLALYSGYRPGSRTSNGSLSYHAMRAQDGDSGRAVDVPPRREVFDWIRRNYLAGTKELIWGGAPHLNIHNGRTYRYSDSLLYQHGPYKGVQGPSPHIHWAYDSGGWLNPGLNMAINGTGTPEAVLTGRQWKDIRTLAQRAAIPGNTVNNFEFRDTTLTPGKWRAMQRADAAYRRVGRAR